MLKLIAKLLPASTIAALVAEYLTKALRNIKNRDRAAKISAAVSATADAVKVVGDAVKDCEVTEAEVNNATVAIESAVMSIIEAAK